MGAMPSLILLGMAAIGISASSLSHWCLSLWIVGLFVVQNNRKDKSQTESTRSSIHIKACSTVSAPHYSVWTPIQPADFGAVSRSLDAWLPNEASMPRTLLERNSLIRIRSSRSARIRSLAFSSGLALLADGSELSGASALRKRSAIG